MRGQRTERSRATVGGPVESGELEALFERGFSLSSRRFIAEAWGLKPESEYDQIAQRVNDPKVVESRLGEVDKLQRVTLSQVAASGGRMRGENLRRDLLLRGFGDTEGVLRTLVERLMLIPLPNPGESELDIEELLEMDSFLQRDLALPVPLKEFLSEEAQMLGPEAIDAWSGDIELIEATATDTLELNLLHLASLLQQETLRLNIDGTPNRRSLARFGRGISFPVGGRNGQPAGEAGDSLDLNDVFQLDYLTFLLALSAELGFVEQQEQGIAGKAAPAEAFFLADQDARNRQLSTAFRGLKLWSEVDSLALSRASGPADSEQHFSQTELTGEPLIGARGYVLSVLKRARVTQWAPTKAMVDLCEQLDKSYLPRALSKVEPPVDPRRYIESVMGRGLMWLGAVEFGHSEDEVEMMRVTPRGAKILGMRLKSEGTPAAKDAAPQAPGCMVVQPNFEVMLFLDPAPLKVVYRLYEIGQRTKLSERVANFHLSAESVQRGLGMGLGSEEIIETLNAYSHAPLPDSVAFQIGDWERVHRKVQLYANGVLLRHPDPDKLDLMLGQLRHAQRDEHGDNTFQMHRLGPESAYLACEDPPELERLVTQHDGLLIDYLGEIPPCLYFVDILEIMVDPLEVDIVTLSELDKIAERQEEDSSEQLFYQLDAKKIRARWPEEPLKGVVDFLAPRVDGGLPAAQELKLRGILDKPLSAAVSREVTVVVLQDAQIAQRFMQIPECEPLIERRLGDTAFAIKREHEEELNELFEELGIVLSE